MAIIDVITYNGEETIWDIRYNILKDYVDEFIVCEALTTFSGNPKPLYFEKIKNKYKKIKYFVIDENYSDEEIKQAEESPNTKGASHWKHEFLQKESIKKALIHLKDDDIVFIGDVDEIPEPIHYMRHEGGAIKLKLRVYVYYLNNRSNEVFWGTIKGFYKDIKNECLNHLRTNNERRCTILENGWHFTSLKDELRRKLIDSYTKESYATDEIMNNLGKNIENNRDFIGRGFIFKTDESELPEYLIKNKQKYAKLFK